MNSATKTAGKYEITVSHDKSGMSGAGRSVWVSVKEDGIEYASIFAESPEEYASLMDTINKAVEQATGRSGH